MQRRALGLVVVGILLVASGRAHADRDPDDEEALQIRDQVYFLRGSAVITRQRRPIVQAVAATLLDHPEILRFEIVGHTDGREPAALGLRRAKAVQAACVAAGVQPSRLTVRNVGATEPREPGDSARAREANRRVGFHVVQASSD